MAQKINCFLPKKLIAFLVVKINQPNISHQCSTSIPPENVRKQVFLTFSGGIKMKQLRKMG